MNAPTRPAKFAGGCVAPLLKNHTGSVGSHVTSATTQSSAAAKSATPRNSLARRDSVEVVTSQISMMTGSTIGRRPDRFLRNRRSSTRTFSRSSPGSVRSSTLVVATSLGNRARAVRQQRFVAGRR